MKIDSATAAQYLGYFQKNIRDDLKRGEVSPEAEEDRVLEILKQQRERVQPVADVKGKIMQKNEPRGYDSQGKLTKLYELGKLGTKIDIIS